MKALLSLAGVTLIFATPATAAELITNGGFEAGNFTGWTQTGNTSFTGVERGAASSGSFGAFIGPRALPGTISQTLATSVGQNYLISFDLGNFDGTPNFYSVLFGGVSLFSASNSAGFAYTNFSTTATAVSSSTDLAFNFQHNPSFFALDNVSVTAVNSAIPEPATWAMLLLGFGFIGGVMRFGKRQQKVIVSYA